MYAKGIRTREGRKLGYDEMSVRLPLIMFILAVLQMWIHDEIWFFPLSVAQRICACFLWNW